MVYRSEDESIHIPGTIQQFGALVALREQEDGSFVVRIASENSQRVIGLAPKDLFELRCLTDLLPRREREDFIARVRSMRSRPEGAKPKTRLDIFSMLLISSVGALNLTWCALHLIRDVNILVCEFELQSDIFNPIAQPNEGLPNEPVSILGDHSSEEAQLLSKTVRSTPLHSVQFARDRGDELGSMVMFHALCEIQIQLAGATTLPIILDVIVGLISELTGFHRVMVYQFDQNACGSVISELVDKRASTDIFRGLHFPASDIPKQARELYMINTIRILYDRDQETARLVCCTLEDAATPLDSIHSYLRAMSPVHLKCLRNMGVQASMSLSLPFSNELWGLVTCHGYGSGMRVSLPLRELCRSLGDIAGAHIEKLIYESRVQTQRPIFTPPLQKTLSAYISAASSDLLNLSDADFGLLTIKDEARSVGRLTAYNEAIALLQYVRMRSFTTIVTSSNIKKDFSELLFANGFSTIAGFLVIPLAMAGSDFLVLFRRGQLKEVSWAGNPYEKTMHKGFEANSPAVSVSPTPANVIPSTSPSNSISSSTLDLSDRIALGTSISIGVPGLVAAMLGVYFTWKHYKNKAKNEKVHQENGLSSSASAESSTGPNFSSDPGPTNTLPSNNSVQRMNTGSLTKETDAETSVRNFHLPSNEKAGTTQAEIFTAHMVAVNYGLKKRSGSI